MTASDYVTGTLTVTNGSVDFTGTGTGWLAAGFKEGDTIIDVTGATEFMGVVATIDANGAGTLTKAWEGPTLPGVAYRMRYHNDGARMGAQARNLIEVLGNGNLQALAAQTGAANKVPMFTGPGAMTLVNKTDLVSGAAYDVQVANLAARAAYDGQVEGYAVLVANVGDGRAAIYSKNSATSADWSDPAYVTGTVGPNPTVTIDSVTTGAPGTAAAVVVTPVTGGVELDFTIPAGAGFTWKGAYSGAAAYAVGDVILNNSSAWIALVATTGNAPPVLPTTSNTQWQLLAAKGTDGTGTGDTVGPAGVVADRIAVFDGTSGKLLKDGGSTIADVVPANDSITNAKLANMATATLKGRATAGTGDPEDLTVTQARAVLGMAAGSVVQSVRSITIANTSISAVLALTDTTPTISNGTQILGAAITPTKIGNKIRGRVNIWGQGSGVLNVSAFACLIGQTNAIGARAQTVTGAFAEEMCFDFEFMTTSLTSLTFTARMAVTSGSFSINGLTSGRLWGGAGECSLVLEEIYA